MLKIIKGQFIEDILKYDFVELKNNDYSFTYYIDGQLAGSHVPIDAEKLENAKYDISIGVTGNKITGYVDDVRIGEIGQ